MLTKTVPLTLALILLGGCNSYKLRYHADPQPSGANLFADYTHLQDAIGVSIDTDGKRLEEVYIKTSDARIIRPTNIAYPAFGKSASVGTGIGIGPVGLGVGVPVGPDHAKGLTTATFTEASLASPPPWELHIKVEGSPEAIIPTFGQQNP